jgi:hypothetical protein
MPTLLPFIFFEAFRGLELVGAHGAVV